MSNRSTHMIVAGVAIGLLAKEGRHRGYDAPNPIAAGVLGSVLTCLPDIAEPAFHPNHRQFFHSVTFGTVVGCGLNRAWEWQPETDGDKFLRYLALIAGSGYLCHLVLDASTPKSLPLIGKF